jgi:lysophospholipase L1-like esterase
MTSATTPSHYLALGDSYTVGEAVAATDRWPAVLVRRLRQAGVMIDPPQIVAVTGWTTDELAHGMDEASLASAYELVTVQIGVNNQYRGRPVDDYRDQFAALLTRAIALAGDRAGRVVAVSIPDWGVTRFAAGQGRQRTVIAAELDAYNAAARDESRRKGAHFVDITDISRSHPGLVADDGLHPSAAQYALWVERIGPVADAALRPPD